MREGYGPPFLHARGHLILKWLYILGKVNQDGRW